MKKSEIDFILDCKICEADAIIPQLKITRNKHYLLITHNEMHELKHIITILATIVENYDLCGVSILIHSIVNPTIYTTTSCPYTTMLNQLINVIRFSEVSKFPGFPDEQNATQEEDFLIRNTVNAMLHKLPLKFSRF